jgi:hypothetical protein
MDQSKGNPGSWFWLAGNLSFPAAALIIGVVYSKGPEFRIDDVDWTGASFPARTLNFILFLSFAYIWTTVLVMHGRRLSALLIGLLIFAVSFVIYFFAYIAVTHIYL